MLLASPCGALNTWQDKDMADQAGAAVAAGAAAAASELAAAERRRAAGGAAVAPAPPNPVFGADIFAQLPQLLLFMLMWHTLMMPGARQNAAKHASQTAPGGPAGSLDQVVAANQMAANQMVAGGLGSDVGFQDHEDWRKFPVRFPMWNVGQEFELYVYLSSSQEALNRTNIKQNGIDVGDRGATREAHAYAGALLWHEERLYLDSSHIPNTRVLNITLDNQQIPQPWRNESVYAHVFFVRNRADPLQHQGTEDVRHGTPSLCLSILSLSFRPPPSPHPPTYFSSCSRSPSLSSSRSPSLTPDLYFISQQRRAHATKTRALSLTTCSLSRSLSLSLKHTHAHSHTHRSCEFGEARSETQGQKSKESHLRRCVST